MVWCIVMRGPQPLSMRSAVDLRTVLETTPVGGRSVVLPDGMGAAMPEPVPEPRPAVDGPTAARELVVLGTASQMPTRDRNHNGYLLRWDGEAILFDPGEGAQRQLLLAGESAASITTVCVTHFHGDHCLGLPGMLHRMAQDGVRRAVDIAFPAAARGDYERLRDVAGAGAPPLTEHPVAGDGLVLETPRFALRAMALDHRTATVGWRLEEPDSRRMLPDRLAAAGVHGPMIGRLQREGRVAVGDAAFALQPADHRTVHAGGGQPFRQHPARVRFLQAPADRRGAVVQRHRAQGEPGRLQHQAVAGHRVLRQRRGTGAGNIAQALVVASRGRREGDVHGPPDAVLSHAVQHPG